MRGRKPLFIPCTPRGCLELLRRSGVALSGKRAAVVGRSNIVGMPVALLLQREDATVTVSPSWRRPLSLSACQSLSLSASQRPVCTLRTLSCTNRTLSAPTSPCHVPFMHPPPPLLHPVVQVIHSKTPDAQRICAEADIVIAACGKAEMITGDWIKPGAAVIDVGINAVDVGGGGGGVGVGAWWGGWIKPGSSLELRDRRGNQDSFMCVGGHPRSSLELWRSTRGDQCRQCGWGWACWRMLAWLGCSRCGGVAEVGAWLGGVRPRTTLPLPAAPD